MWTTVYITHDKKASELLVKHLRENGILSRMRRIGGGEHCEYEVLVPQPEVNYAQNLIIDNELF